ncbi:MAG: hypothetical protein D6714_19060 [Bacteroidetes bacterium]|nr:MAG: hypothetical protein D6714_19060 [Bacteroidota bacterium]
MKNKYIAVLMIWSVLSMPTLSAQITLSRSVMCSVGATQSATNGMIVTSTFGQCPGCTTYVSADGTILIQGFQQPLGSDDAQPDCAHVADFDYDEVVSVCGTTYDFFYTGDADVSQASFEWNFGTDAFPQTSSLQAPVGVSFSGVGTKTVALRVVTPDCDVTRTLDLTVSDIGFSVNADITHVGCKGETTGSILLQTNAGTPPFVFSWDNGASTPAINNLPAGNYAYTVTDSQGCLATNQVTVEEPTDHLAVTFNITKASCGQSEDGVIEAIVTGGTPPYSYEWSNGETTPTIQNLNPGAYSVVVTDNNGCVLNSNNGTELSEACRPLIYNIVTPNGDGMNDTWEIEDVQNFPDISIHIYNRWGALVFDTKGYQNDWAGTDNSGNPLLSGAYYYVVELNDGHGITLTGPITLVR